jgi:bacteriocin biosynthesis cyclodehydratase domain-containing protein
MGESLVEAPALPERPLLKPWYRHSVDEDGVVLRYGTSVLELHGAAATRLLPSLLPLLDGRRGRDDVVACLGEPIRPAVEHALGVLHAHRLLTEAGPKSLGRSAGRAAELLAATDPLDRGVAEAAARLGGSHVVLLGSAPVAGVVATLLAESGVGAVHRESWDEPQPADLVVAVPSDDELPLLRQWNARALTDATPWLQLLPFDGLIAAVGPLFVPGDTACHECYLLRRAANLSSRPYRPESVERGVFPGSPALDAVLAGLAATAALRWLALADGLIPGLVVAVEQVPEPAVSRHVLYRVPRCPACSRGRRRATIAPWHEGPRHEGPRGTSALHEATVQGVSDATA